MEACENLVEVITSVLNDNKAFSCRKSPATGESDKETETKMKISSAYRAFAIEYGFGLNFEVRGMRGGLGAFTDAAPDDYLISTDDKSFQIFIGFDGKSNKRVQLTIPDSRKASAEKMLRLLAENGVKIVLFSPKEKDEAIQKYWAEYRRLDDIYDFNH